ncbi:MAG: PAS domain-containing protein, partial [Pseudomonadota bacterium]|nr:PAS domain-containing protein [Pseudomonadota bacterium]
MRNNQPVTQREYVLDEETVLISRTDLKGNVTYANAAFVEVSGYSRDELL